MSPKWIVICVSAALFIVCDGLAYKWAKHNGSNWLLLVVALLGGIGYVGFCLVCQYIPLGSATPTVGVLVAVGAVVVGYLAYNETLTWQQALGIVCAIAAVILLSFHAPPPPPQQ